MINRIHQPVMTSEVIDQLIVSGSGIYLDATCGFGGHTELILKTLNSDGKVVAIDQDLDAIKFVKEKFIGQSRFKIIKGRFGNI